MGRIQSGFKNQPLSGFKNQPLSGFKTRPLSGFERQLCDIQGRLFERSLKKSLDSADFVEKFMNSNTCAFLDLPYDRLQWAGEEYILEDLLEETTIRPAGQTYDSQLLGIEMPSLRTVLKPPHTYSAGGYVSTLIPPQWYKWH